MLALIVCTYRPSLLAQLRDNVAQTIGCDYELIAIDNQDGHHTLASAYNEGAQQTRADYLCFVHEDMQFVSPDWGRRIAETLASPDVGIVGVAGSAATFPFPCQWTGFATYIYPEQTHEAGILDGQLLACRREVFSQCHFDEQLPPWHGYDYDICLAAQTLGLHNYVLGCITVHHLSGGNRNSDYTRAVMSIYDKHHAILGWHTEDISDEAYRHIMPRQLQRTLRLMIRTGCPTAQLLAFCHQWAPRYGSRWLACAPRTNILWQRLLLKLRKH